MNQGINGGSRETRVRKLRGPIRISSLNGSSQSTTSMRYKIVVQSFISRADCDLISGVSYLQVKEA
jgi:hypothetical protein